MCLCSVLIYSACVGENKLFKEHHGETIKTKGIHLDTGVYDLRHLFWGLRFSVCWRVDDLAIGHPAYFTSFYTDMLPHAPGVCVISVTAASRQLLQDLHNPQVRITCQKLLDLYILTILEQQQTSQNWIATITSLTEIVIPVSVTQEFASCFARKHSFRLSSGHSLVIKWGLGDTLC